MIITRFSLAATSLLFIIRADAQSEHQQAALQPRSISASLSTSTPPATSTPASTILFSIPTSPAPSSTFPSDSATTNPASISSIGDATANIPGSLSTASLAYFYTDWTMSDNPVPLAQLVNYTYEYYSPSPPSGVLTLNLCQTNTSTIPNQDNVWLVLQVPLLDVVFSNDVPQTFQLQFEPVASDSGALLWPFFFCWGIEINSIMICESFSPSFTISNGTNSTMRKGLIPQPQAPLVVTLSTQVLSISGLGFSSSTSFVQLSTDTIMPSSTSTSNFSPSVLQTSSRGLSTGAKVGLTVGPTILFIILLLGAFAYIRWLNRRTNNNAIKPVVRSKPKIYELVADVYRHELFTKANTHEMEQETQGIMRLLNKMPHEPKSPLVLDIPRELGSTADIPHRSEHETRNEAERWSGPKEGLSEGLAETSPRSVVEEESKLGMLQERMKNIKAERQATQAESSSSMEQDEKKLGILQDRIERIRAEKERLERIQRLEELEEETKREIIEASRRIAEKGQGNSNLGY